MNGPPEGDDLLDAVLAESAPVDFRATLLGETLHLVRQRRQWRRARRTVAVLAMLSLLGAGVWRSWPAHQPSRRPPATGYEIVRTQPLPVGSIVSSRPFGLERMVATFASVGVVRTRPAREHLHVIDDVELLALAAPRLPALVRTGPHTQELIFLKPAEPESGTLN
jgi:hypothetical protein